jgi:hypothetical protein
MIGYLVGLALCCGNDMGVSPWPQQAPSQYNHAYRGHLVTHYETREQIHARCGMNARACAAVARGACTIYLPVATPGSSPEVLEALRAHELAHCNGWRH